MTQIMLQTPTNASMAMFTQFAMIAAMFAILYFFMIRPQKKKEKEIQLMRSKLEVGDEIVTIGGIIGRVVNIKDETIVIETSDDRVRMELTKWAVSQVGVQTGEQPEAEKKEKKAEKKAAKKAEKKSVKKAEKKAETAAQASAPAAK